MEERKEKGGASEIGRKQDRREERKEGGRLEERERREKNSCPHSQPG
jgi:hypothetical protein